MASYATDLDFLRNRAPHFLPLFYFNTDEEVCAYDPNFVFSGTKGQQCLTLIPGILLLELCRGPAGFVDRIEAIRPRQHREHGC